MPDPEKALRRAGIGLLGIALIAGFYSAIDRASLFDDAYISLRYAKNLVDGHGLVWNPGEYVEGYTNFLWTILLAGLMATLPVEGPLLSVVLALLSYVANVLVVYRLSRRLAGEGSGPLLAPVLFAVQIIVVGYATTGLETQFASLLVNLGALFLIRSASPRDAGLAGTFLILATLTRPDHAIFYACGALAIAAATVRAARNEGAEDVRGIWRHGWRPVVAYSIPFLLYLAHLAFRLHYYGDFWPNTYYAKLADTSYYLQGGRYLLLFTLASHYWIVAVLLVGWVLTRASDEADRRYRWFAFPSILLFVFYVVRVGGDFMHGRFFVTLIPLALLGAEQLCRSLRSGAAHRRRGIAATAALASTVFGMQIHEKGGRIWQTTEETDIYAITQWRPEIVVSDYNYRAARAFQTMAEAGLRPVISSTSCGMIGYYSGLTVIDQYGLTDHYVARVPVEHRGRPGHERAAPREYLEERGVWIARRHAPPEPYAELARVKLGPKTGSKHWYLLYYDAEKAQQLREALPEGKVVKFEKHLDRYVRKARKRKAEMDAEEWMENERPEIERDLEWFDAYYFDHNEDPRRRAKLENLLESTGG